MFVHTTTCVYIYGVCKSVIKIMLSAVLMFWKYTFYNKIIHLQQLIITQRDTTKY